MWVVLAVRNDRPRKGRSLTALPGKGRQVQSWIDWFEQWYQQLGKRSHMASAGNPSELRAESMSWMSVACPAFCWFIARRDPVR